MKSTWKTILRPHRANAVLLDANLLVLWVIGQLGPDRFLYSKRVSQFEYRDYNLLRSIEPIFRGVCATPYVLSQASDLTTLPGKDGELARQLLKNLVLRLDIPYTPPEILVNHSCFSQLGLADVSLLNHTPTRTTILTTDLQLFLHAQRMEIPAVNFNNLRSIPFA